MERLVQVLIIFLIGGVIVVSPINMLIHEFIHKFSLSKLGIKSEIALNFYYFKFEVEKLKWSFVSNKKERTLDCKTHPIWEEFNKCNKKQRIMVYLLPTIILTIIPFVLLISYLIVSNQPITNNISILIIFVIMFQLLCGTNDFIDSYKLYFDK